MINTRPRDYRTWLVFIKIAFVVAVITLVDFLLIYPWFIGSYTVNSGSFEPIFLAYASFIKNNFPGFTFNPLWYLGFPNRFAFPPFFFYLIAFVSLFWKNLSFGQIYHLLTGGFFLFLPISALIFLRNLKVSWFSALLTVILFTFYPSIFYLFPSLYKEVAQFSFPPPLILFLSYFGLGPRIIGLVFSLTGLSFLVKFIRKQSKINCFLTALFSGAVFLTDQVTSVGYLVLAIALGLSFILFKPIKQLKCLILITAGLIAWFYNFSYITNLYFAPSLAGMSFSALFSKLFKVFFLGVPLILGLFSRKFVKEEKNQPLTFATLSVILFGLVILIYYFENPQFVSEFVRFIPEFGLVSSILIAAFVSRKWLTTFKLQLVFLVILSIIPVMLISKWQKIVQSTNDPSSFREYQLSSYLKTVNPQRVYATGAMAFWLNNFTDIVQVRGGSDQAAVHKWLKDASFYLREGEDSLTTLLWLKALNITHLVVNDQTSQEFYQADYKNLERFEKDYRILYNQNGDKILAVPLNNSSLAQIVAKKEIKSIQLASVKDVQGLSSYVEWVDTKARPVKVTWITTGQFIIEGEVKENEALVVQIAYDSRWQAESETGKRIRVLPDPLGFMYIESETSFNKLTLSYKETFDIWIGILITLITIGSFLKASFTPLTFQNFHVK